MIQFACQRSRCTVSISLPFRFQVAGIFIKWPFIFDSLLHFLFMVPRLVLPLIKMAGAKQGDLQRLQYQENFLAIDS